MMFEKIRKIIWKKGLPEVVVVDYDPRAIQLGAKGPLGLRIYHFKNGYLYKKYLYSKVILEDFANKQIPIIYLADEYSYPFELYSEKKVKSAAVFEGEEL